MNPVDLLAVLDGEDPAKARARLEQLRKVLRRFFEWRGMEHAEDLVHEVLVRGMERIGDGAAIYAKDPGGFFYGIAKNVLREETRRMFQDQTPVPEPDPGAYRPGPGLNPLETKIYLEQCLAHLSQEERELLMGYINGAMPPDGTSSGLQRLRAHRIRKKLWELRKK